MSLGKDTVPLELIVNDPLITTNPEPLLFKFKLPLVKGQVLDDWLSNQFQIKYQADKEKN
jgi:hypothetical protein